MSEEQAKSYYAIIPASVRYDPNLKDKAKLLYGEITALCNEKGYCWATNDYFANLYGVSKTTISLLIKNLIESGYLHSQIIYKEGTKEILNRYLSIVKDPIKENLNTPIKEKLKDNNTYINNTSNNTYEIYSPAKAEQQSANKELEQEFESIWKEYPNKKGKPNALKSYIKARKKGTTYEEVLKGLENYVKYITIEKTQQQYIKHGSTWFNQECWNDDYSIKRKLTTKDIQDKIDFSDF